MPTALLLPNAKVAELSAAPRVRASSVRRSEWVVFAFLAYAVVVSRAIAGAPVARDRIFLVNLTLGLLYAVLIRRDSAHPNLALSVARDWLPLAVTLLAYREMGWLAAPHPTHDFESHLVVWDRLFLRGGAKSAIESLGPVLPTVLELAYAVVYVIPPFSLAALYLLRRRDLADRFLFVFSLGVLMVYAQFPFWPSEPPRVIFFTEDLPTYVTVIRRFNLWMLGSYGIHTSVFPSAHVAGAFASAFAIEQLHLREKWLHRLLLALAILIAFATVYGRYHYLADAAAGLAVACVAAALANLWGPFPRTFLNPGHPHLHPKNNPDRTAVYPGTWVSTPCFPLRSLSRNPTKSRPAATNL